MKLFALTFGDETCASTQYRLLQYRGLLQGAGIELTWAEAKKVEHFESLANYDAVILQKTPLAGGKVAQIRRYARRLIYDADDRIWMRPGRAYGLLTRMKINRRMRKTMRSADLCIAANQVIADDLKEYGANRVKILPMALDGEVWKPGQASSDGPVLGWTGAPANLPWLEELASEFRKVRERCPDVRLVIHCGQRPRLGGLEFEHVPFEPGKEVATVARFDIGLLPMPNEAFTLGKSPIKVLHYFATATAVVGQAFGATCELLTNDENALIIGPDRPWHEAICQLLENEDRRRQLSEAGRRCFLERHDAPAVFARWRELLETVIAR